MPSRRAVLLAVLGVLVVALVAGTAWWGTNRAPRADVVDDATGPAGWKTLEYEGVRVDVPDTWERLDRGDCEFGFESWGPPGTSACRPEAGVAFYASATFDPAHGPGVRAGERPGDPPWGGYATTDDVAVYVTGDDREVVEQVVASAR